MMESEFGPRDETANAEACHLTAAAWLGGPLDLMLWTPAFAAFAQRIFDSHLAILSTPWWPSSRLDGVPSCPFCGNYADHGCPGDCPIRISARAGGISD